MTRTPQRANASVGRHVLNKDVSSSRVRAMESGKSGGQVFRVLLFVILAIFYTHNALSLGLSQQNSGPDELMRSLIPRCIVNGNLIPSGYDRCAIMYWGNWSYAFYPQMLSGYVSAAFMSVAKLLNLSAEAVFTAGRFASVLFGLVAVFAVGRIVAVLFRGQKKALALECLTICIMGFWPQFAFLSSYMNNDITALCGVAVLSYALVSGLELGWRVFNAIILAVGITLCGLGYWNSYGFILIALVIFIATAWRRNADKAAAARLIGMAAGITAVLVLPWFVLNIVRYHDMIGMRTFHARYVEWLAAGGEQLQHPYTEGLRKLLLGSDFVSMTVTSFIGYLGSMTAPIPFLLALLYCLLVGSGFGMFLSRLKYRWLNRNFRIMFFGLTVASLITLCLYVYYNMHTDYQPQGRYIIYVLIPLLLMFSIGFGDSFEMDGKYSVVFLFLFMIIYMALCLTFFAMTAIQYNWNGVQGIGAI